MTSILGINVENISTKENIVNENTNINISATNLKNVIDTCQEIKNEVIDFALNKYAEIYFVLASEETPHNYTYQLSILHFSLNNLQHY